MLNDKVAWEWRPATTHAAMTPVPWCLQRLPVTRWRQACAGGNGVERDAQHRVSNTVPNKRAVHEALAPLLPPCKLLAIDSLATCTASTHTAAAANATAAHLPRALGLTAATE